MNEAREAAYRLDRDRLTDGPLYEKGRKFCFALGFNAGWEAAIAWAREQHQPRPLIACGGCGMRTDAGGADGSFICPSCLAVNRGDQSFTPGQYRQARGIAPPAAGEPSVEETMREEP